MNDVQKSRRKLGLSQSEFANALKASKRTVEKWEQGERSPNRLVMKQIRVMLWFYENGSWDEYLSI